MKQYSIFILLFLSVTIASAQVNVPAYVPLGSLEAWWPFTGNAIDSSGNGNNGTVHGCTLTTDRFGNANSAYNFDGHSNWIYIPPGLPLELIKSVTIAAWVFADHYTADSSGGQAQIFWRGDLTSAHDPYMLYVSGPQIKFRRDIDPGGTIINQVGFNSSIMDVTKWHHIVGIFDLATGNMLIYFDGVLQSEAHLPGTISYAMPVYWNSIGAVDNGGWQFFKGVIDDVGAWDRRLMQCEISKLYLGLANLIVRNTTTDSVSVGASATFSITDTCTVLGMYQWQENSGSGYVDLVDAPPYSGVFTQTLTITPATMLDSGNLYRCIRIDSTHNCYDTSGDGVLIVSDTITSTPSLGMSNISNAMDFSVAPNPSNGEFTIKGLNVARNNTELLVEVTNIMGQTVYSTKIPVQNRRINERLLLRNVLQEGVYLLRLHTETSNKVLQIVISH